MLKKYTACGRLSSNGSAIKLHRKYIGIVLKLNITPLRYSVRRCMDVGIS